MRGIVWAAVLGGVVGLGELQAAKDDTYDLRGPAPVKGMVTVTKSVTRIKNATVEIKVGGRALTMKQTKTMTSEEEEKVLVVDGRQVTKSQTKILKDETKTVSDFNGDKMDDTTKNDLDGEVFLSERTADGKWKHTLVDSKPTDDQKKELDKRLGPECDDDLFPAGKVKVGHKWTVEAASMKRFFGNGYTDIKGKLAKTFLRVEDVDGEPCAVVESRGPITAKSKDEDAKMDVKLDVTLTSWRSLKTGVDVKGKVDGRIRLSGKQKIDGVEADVTLEGTLSGEDTTKVK